MSNEYVKEPRALKNIVADTKKIGFDMCGEKDVGVLLRVLGASKSGEFLELGTGTGLSTAWILDGMDENSHLITVDNDEKLLSIAKKHLGHYKNVEFVCDDGNAFLERLKKENKNFDFIFADTWAGKYEMLEDTLEMLNEKAFYIIDDMLPQSNWPEGHEKKVEKLIDYLHNREDLEIVNLGWSSGVIVCVKK
ncbi:O-methyltransferase [Caminibacter pacificus]|uniref:Methyltransferase domain-containing protein n=1 Tax=Caminibacter pacificus TaxID=1424653 RepID=A0AAJ4RBG9_9BACT|nr:class I SAM-dependent methyltransferase [Caminibacter pacificus]QCI29151.1 methyltransferase domain-containing protein [Caminibacter pacificus]ROR39030.1 putative O-methyltransferase YrrM [Caminibacter pacificus]